jgi:hypothetical protein
MVRERSSYDARRSEQNRADIEHVMQELVSIAPAPEHLAAVRKLHELFPGLHIDLDGQRTAGALAGCCPLLPAPGSLLVRSHSRHSCGKLEIFKVGLEDLAQPAA